MKTWDELINDPQEHQLPPVLLRLLSDYLPKQKQQ